MFVHLMELSGSTAYFCYIFELTNLSRKGMKGMVKTKVFATCRNDVRVLVLGSFSYLFYVAFAVMAAIFTGYIYLICILVENHTINLMHSID